MGSTNSIQSGVLALRLNHTLDLLILRSGIANSQVGLLHTHWFNLVFLEEYIRQRDTDQIRSDSTPRFYILILKYCGVATIPGKHYKHNKQCKLKHEMTLISILATSLERDYNNFKKILLACFQRPIKYRNMWKQTQIIFKSKRSIHILWRFQANISSVSPC